MFTESQSAGSAALGGVFVCRYTGNCIGDGFGGGFIEEGACRIFDDGVEGATCFSGNDGASGCLGFDGGDAEVFDLGEEEGIGALVLGAELVVGEVPEESDERSGVVFGSDFPGVLAQLVVV